jgi:hypothetical protein
MSQENEPKETPPAPATPALKRERQKRKLLEESLRRKTTELEKKDRELERIKRKNEQLEKELEKLKQELCAKRKLPKWVKSNKSEKEKKKAKKRGPKAGHSPNIRKVPEKIDREVTLVPKQCPDCEGELSLPSKWHTHTQIDIPAVQKTIVTRFSVGWCYCSHCEKEVSSKEKLSGSKYGPNLHTQVMYWKYSLGLTFGKIAKLLKDQFNLEISTGQLSEMAMRGGRKFNAAYEDIGAALKNQAYLHADETGWRVEGTNHWLWSFSNDKLSYYVIDRSRGQKVVESKLGKAFDGVLITDFYGGYNEIKSSKQKCWTHLLRELRELKKAYPSNDEIKLYSKQLKLFFKRGNALKEEFEAKQNIDKKYLRLWKDTQKFASEKRKHADLQRISKRITKFRSELYTFIKTGTDPTNNNGEREIRPAVLMRKTSYCNRSAEGAETQSKMMSIIRTYEKQGINFVEVASDHLSYN